jgi:hypothetical protein
MAYQSDESGRWEVHVMPFSSEKPGESQARWQVSNGGGTWPAWRSDGRELFYSRQNAEGAITIMAAAVSGGRTFEVGQLVPLFELPPRAYWDAAPDGQRFLVVRRKAYSAPPPYFISLNWLAMARSQTAR